MANEFTSTNDKGLRTHELKPSLLAEASFPWYFRPPNTRGEKASASMEVKAIILCSSQACLFISETTSAFPSKVKCSSPSHEEWAGGEWDTQNLLGHAVSCFWSERQLNNIGHAYFYLMGVAFYSYSSFQPGRLQ